MKSTFARKHLAKHGWKEGAGLGRHESGIKEAIKVKIKHDLKGVGHDPGEEYTYNWWDHVFNKAANSIHVKHSRDGVTVSQEGDSGPISNKKRKTFSDKDMMYGKFIKGSTLTNGSEASVAVHSDSSDGDEETSCSRRPTEEEIFAKCSGRTAHKAARHGLKLNGKLVRVQEQEAELLRKLHNRSHGNSTNQKDIDALQIDSPKIANAEISSFQDVEMKCGSPKRRKDDTSIEKDNECVQIVKRKRKKKKNDIAEEDLETFNTEEINNGCSVKKKKKKRKKDKTEVASHSLVEPSQENVILVNVDSNFVNSNKKKL